MWALQGKGQKCTKVFWRRSAESAALQAIVPHTERMPASFILLVTIVAAFCQLPFSISQVPDVSDPCASSGKRRNKNNVLQSSQDYCINLVSFRVHYSNPTSRRRCCILSDLRLFHWFEPGGECQWRRRRRGEEKESCNVSQQSTLAWRCDLLRHLSSLHRYF